MNYKIIQDEEELDRFLSILPETTPDEKYYVSLLARKKYFPENSDYKISVDRGQIKRFLASKHLIKDKLKQLEVEIGAYKFENRKLPQGSLAVYITPNPRSMRLATKKSIHRFVELISDPNNTGYNPYQEVLSQVQTSRSRTIWMDFDFDVGDNKPDISGRINNEAVTWVKTHGGYHLLIEVEKVSSEYKKTYYNNIIQVKGCDVRGADNLLPIPGCCQGGFVPYII